MLIASYERWRESETRRLQEENPMVDCVECDGTGGVYSVCDCCGAENEGWCDVCGGDGYFRFLDSPKPRPGEDLVGPDAYFRAVIADLRKWAAYTGSDFLNVSGGFVKTFRSQYGGVKWSR